VRKTLENITESSSISYQEKIIHINELGIEIVPEPESWQQKDNNHVIIVCYSYALGLGESDHYRTWVIESPNYCANSDFIRFLLQELLLRPITKVSIGDIALYFDEDDNPKHAGIVTGLTKRIRSKWGDIAIFEHELWHVPASYGSKVVYYQRIETLYTEECYRRYIDSRLRGNDNVA
jgi:hypothetical protein